MAEHGEIVAGASGIGALLGAFFGAWKLFRPGKVTPEKEEASMGAILQRIAKLEQRADSHETARIELRADLGKVFDKLEDLVESNSRIEGALGTGKAKR